MRNRKNSVMHILSSFEQGGAEKLLLYFLKERTEGMSVTIMNNQVDDDLGQELLKTGCKVYFLGRMQGHKHPKYLFRLLTIIKENNINIIHSHEDGGMMWSILSKILKPKLKLVYTIHSSPIVKNWSKGMLLINRVFMNMNIAISKDIFNNCVEKKLAAIQIYNGIDTKRFRPAQGYSEHSFSMINVGRITHRIKGQDILIKALKECKNKGMEFSCNFVGGEVFNDDRTSFDYLKSQIADLDLSEEVHFWGNREDVPELLAQSDVFILPSRYEGLPLSLLEAMAARLPVIASNISGSAELVEHGKNGLLFESGNHLDLAEKIIYLYDHRKEMERLAQNAYEYVQGFDISVMCEKYWDLYKCLVK